MVGTRGGSLDHYLEAMYLQFSKTLMLVRLGSARKQIVVNISCKASINPEYCSNRCKWNHNNNNSKDTKKKERMHTEFPNIEKVVIDQMVDNPLEKADNNLRNLRKRIKNMLVDGEAENGGK